MLIHPRLDVHSEDIDSSTTRDDTSLTETIKDLRMKHILASEECLLLQKKVKTSKEKEDSFKDTINELDMRLRNLQSSHRSLDARNALLSRENMALKSSMQKEQTQSLVLLEEIKTLKAQLLANSVAMNQLESTTTMLESENTFLRKNSDQVNEWRKRVERYKKFESMAIENGWTDNKRKNQKQLHSNSTIKQSTSRIQLDDIFKLKHESSIKEPLLYQENAPKLGSKRAVKDMFSTADIQPVKKLVKSNVRVPNTSNAHLFSSSMRQKSLTSFIKK